MMSYFILVLNHLYSISFIYFAIPIYNENDGANKEWVKSVMDANSVRFDKDDLICKLY